MRIKAYRFAMAAALLIMAGVAVASAQVSCANSITACGCTISTAGVYTVDADLDYTQGLTSKKGCIDVTAANVKLFTNGHPIIGAGTGKGIGIHVLSGATSAFIEAAGVQGTSVSYSVLLGWQYGLESQAPGVTADGFGYDVNTTGVFVKGAANNTIAWSEAIGNSIYGMWISGGSGNQISGANISDNAVAGIYLGCSSTGPMGQVCTGRSGSVATKSNSIYALTVGGIQNYGIAVEQGGSLNTVVNNSSSGNTTDDLFDGNSGCGSNLWQANAFVTSNNSSCIH